MSLRRKPNPFRKKPTSKGDKIVSTGKRPIPDRKKANKESKWLTVQQLIDKARERGFEIKKSVLICAPAERKKKLAKYTMGTGKKMKLNQEAFNKILLILPKRAVVPKGYYTIKRAIEIGIERGIIHPSKKDAMTNRLRNKLANPQEIGIAHDLFDKHHRRLIPERIVETFLDKIQEIQETDWKEVKDGTTIPREWKNIVRNNTNTVIKHLMESEGLTRQQARELMIKENISPARTFGTPGRSNGPRGYSRDITVKYDLGNGKYYWTKENTDLLREQRQRHRMKRK